MKEHRLCHALHECTKARNSRLYILTYMVTEKGELQKEIPPFFILREGLDMILSDPVSSLLMN